MRAPVPERKDTRSMRGIDLPFVLEPDSVKRGVHTVGLCGGDVHDGAHDGAWPRRVTSPMVPGHKAAGTVVELGVISRDTDVSERAPGLIASGRVDLKPLAPETLSFGNGIKAFERAREGGPADVNLQTRI